MKQIKDDIVFEEVKEPKIALFAIADKGEGRIMEVGRYDSIEDIGDIIVGMFDKDTVLSLEYVFETD
jgi:hypothetical protein